MISSRRRLGAGPRILLAAALIAAAAGCSHGRLYRIVPEEYPSKPDDYVVKLYVNKVKRPHREIAFVDSRALPDRSEVSQAKQLRQLQELAQEAGADAVHDVRAMTQKVRGMVMDEAVPFQAYKQGNYKLYFLRGVAIVYLPEALDSGAAPAAASQPPAPPVTSEPGAKDKSPAESQTDKQKQPIEAMPAAPIRMGASTDSAPPGAPAPAPEPSASPAPVPVTPPPTPAAPGDKISIPRQNTEEEEDSTKPQ